VESSPDLEEGRVIPLERGITIGRSDGADLSIVDAFVSHMHARILRRGTYHFVEDLGSTNGTFLNDLRVEHDAQLKVHDTLRIGQTTLRYEE
jgi:pSer/pThr/pTyr-binding forkhead associated (FHA) protein